MNSTGDWDITGTWSLSTTVYISAPSSLETHYTGVVTALIKTSTIPIASVKEGRIVTYCRSTIMNSYCFIVFRYQDASNYYYVKWEPNTWLPDGQVLFSVHRVKDGSDTQIGFASPKGFNTTGWFLIRVTWWNDYVGLVIRFEYWDGSAWQKGCADVYDTNNYWKDIGGRVGLFLHCGDATYHVWVDDTYIYGIG